MLRLSHTLLASTAVALAFAATPAVTQETNGHVQTYGVEATRTFTGFGIDSTTPSRIESSRREMNRGRLGGDRGFRSDMSPAETLDYAERVIRRAGFVCDVVDAAVAVRSNAYAPFVEVHCEAGGGLVVADTAPLQWVDCLDIPADGYEISHNNTLEQCRLPGNIASAAPPQVEPDNN